MIDSSPLRHIESMKLTERVWTVVGVLGLLAGCTVPSADEGGDGDDEATDTGEGTDSTSDTGSDSSTDESSDSTSDTGSDSSTGGSDSSTGGSDFALVAVAFEDQSTLVLTFSEPLGPLDGVEPTSFRISYGQSTLDVYEGMEYAYTWYVDPNIFMFEPDCQEDYGNVCPKFVPFEIASLEAGAIPEQLILHTSAPLDEAVCEKLALNADYEPVPPDMFEDGLFPHYAPKDTPLVSAEGEELAPIGPEWVLFEGDPLFLGGGPLDVIGFGFENLDPKLPIPCP